MGEATSAARGAAAADRTEHTFEGSSASGVPTVVFDGGCGFCKRFIARWRQLTGERVRYVAFDGEGPSPLPTVTADALRRAVHLALPDGSVFAGAAAVAELGRYTGRVAFFRWAYRRVPGVRPASELGYRFVSAHRGLASALATIVVGRDLRRPRQVLVRWLFLRLLGVTALCATLSWWVQLDGLVGSSGIAPAAELMTRAHMVAASEGWGVLESLRQLPTLAWLSASDGMLHALCALAALGSVLLIANVLPGPGLALTWLAYLSLVTTGGVFMGYQWDALLLESLFVALFVVPWRGLRPRLDPARAPPWAGVWLVRLLVFKLMFLSGAVKLASEDPTWADLTALDFHYWTQPLPAPTSWLAHHAPEWTRDLGIRLMFVVELAMPWLIFVGSRRLRHVAAYGTIGLMLAIGLTGNYGYFNLLAGTLALMLFDDDALRALVPRRWRARLPDSHTFAHARPVLVRRVPMAIVATWLALLSLAAMWLRLDRDDAPSALADEVAFFQPLHLANSYGLFATMTTERPEIELSGSVDGVTWRPYRFAWKAALDGSPAFTGPHMPRLDWQMWFAALAGDCRRARWYPRFLERIFAGSRDVLDLLAEDPFPDGPPRFLRSELAYYSFTTPEERAASGATWHREPYGLFCPTLDRDARTRRGGR